MPTVWRVPRRADSTLIPSRSLRRSLCIILRFVLAAVPTSIVSLTLSSSRSGTSLATPSKPKLKPNCTNNGTYENLRHERVPRPQNCSTPPEGATAQCRDGTYSFQYTCSHHGGVAKWL